MKDCHRIGLVLSALVAHLRKAEAALSFYCKTTESRGYNGNKWINHWEWTA